MDKVLIFKQFSLAINSDGHSASILQNIDLEIKKGKITGLIGSSGSGKTMLLRSCMALFEDIHDWHSTGSLTYITDEEKLELIPINRDIIYKVRREEIAFVLQQSSQVLNPSEHIRSILKKAMSTAGHEADEIIIAEALIQVGFKNPESIMSRFPHQLSGGQVQRILIAAALLRKASVLLVDEPTSNLDEELKHDILELLSKINKEYHTTMILVSHDLKLVGPYCDHLLVLKNGQIVEQGRAVDLLNHPKEEYTRGLLQKGFQKVNMIPQSKELIFEMKDVSKTFRKKIGLFGTNQETIILKDFSLKLYKSEILGIIGPSGSGKSSLAKIMAALDEASSGELYYKSVNLNDFTREDFTKFRTKLKIIFQDPLGSLPPHLTSYDILKEVADLNGKKLSEQEMTDYIDRFGLEEGILFRRPSKMSGGQRQRLLIARALLSDPEILICDEILSSLDAAVKIQIIHLLENLRKEYGLSLVFISHDKSLLDGFCDRIITIPSRFVDSVKE